MAAIQEDHDAPTKKSDDDGTNGTEEDPLTEAPWENDDWMATCAIYGGDDNAAAASTHVATNCQQGGGVEASISVALCDESTWVFARRIDEEHDTGGGRFRYFRPTVPPTVRLVFLYEDPMETPSSVSVSWEVFPSPLELPDEKELLDWLTDKCQAILSDDEGISFAVCEFCEHHSLSTYWKLIHQQDEYRLLLLPPKQDHLYHSHIGRLIHPRDEARRQREGSTMLATASNADDYARQALISCWTDLYQTNCPICFDTMYYSEGVVLPVCHHFVCRECLIMYLQVKVTELKGFRTNPFLCPMEKCRRELPIVGFVKSHIRAAEMESIRQWIKDVKHPPCFSLDRCLSKFCQAEGCMRRHEKPMDKLVFCEMCDRTYCELCLKRLDDDGSIATHKGAECTERKILHFCRRYMAATDEMKEKCQSIYPWIVSYALARYHDGEAKLWILQNGQCCPNCSTGVERIEGCFHMKCPTCATHFCYECGEELFAPFYGTHHCWEQNELNIWR